MEQSPSEKLIVTQLIKKLTSFLGTRSHYRIYKSPLLVPVLSQMHPAYNISLYVPEIHSNVILPSTPMSPERSIFPSGFPTKILYSFLISHVCYVPHQSHPLWLHHPYNIWWSVPVMVLLIIQYSQASRHFLSLRSKYYFQHPVLKHLLYS